MEHNSVNLLGLIPYLNFYLLRIFLKKSEFVDQYDKKTLWQCYLVVTTIHFTGT